MSRKLTTLKPRVQSLTATRVPILEAKASTTQRIRGSRWVKTRKRIAVEQQFKCQRCGCVWLPWRDQVDHDVPLEQGGSNDDSNLRLLCDDCHKLKTADEASARAR
ncbi:HNH endonuclease [Paraburkholderia sp. CNPSo 3272]|uniref:HNH endonuclease n=1 Tax=Paraburkholderia sp. CNPSo 3272 TaxID=2940931 RepID=UPI0020B8EE93|nr:HNH endonuclease signature motif containing protein [Paraburkholderia sp. CNPSo 3272]MCP3721741.1 HNH endonuclease [Paraburkholderia sp. CNPSo 3272]